jgi:hypothetical protein
MRRLWRSLRREGDARSEREEWRVEVVGILGDSRQPPTERMLVMLRSVALEQLSIQVVAAGSLDTQAAGALAGAAGLAAVDLALGRWAPPLVLALISSTFSIRTILGAGLRASGPSPGEILNGRDFIDERGDQVTLSDSETESVVLGDLEKAIRQNGRQLGRKARTVFRATVTLLFGLAALVLSQGTR